MEKLYIGHYVDRFNYYAIDWLEKLGNQDPTESQIKVMESLLSTLSVLRPVPIEYNKFKELIDA